MSTFILNDETVVNSYGFRVRNAGLSLDRFRANPVMLDQHWNSTGSVLGKWTNIRIEGSHLLADSDFDLEDEAAKRIHGKVERGVIKAASMGISFDREQMLLQPDGNYDLMAAELFEASIVAIPSNASALRLYAAAGEPLTEVAIKTHLSALNLTDHKNKTTMKKIAISIAALAALGLQTQPNEDEAGMLSQAIEDLKKNYDNELALRQALQAKLDEQVKAQAHALVEAAILDGKLTAEVKTHFVEMAVSNYELAAKVIGSMPAKTKLSVSNSDTPEVKTVDDFAKLTVAAQLKFKTEQPDAYKNLFA